MYKKSFVSINFAPKRLQILQLNAAKNRIVKSGSVSLPPNLISGYKVTDINALSTIIKDSWKRLGIKEKYVGLVVPEFSTFTKSLKLPKLSVHELNEAVRWQSSDFLPGGGEEMTLDWKIIKEEVSEYQLLVAAIPTPVLAGYSEAVESAGLYPVAVETPSLSLVRLAAGPDSKLLIYSNGGEAILIAAYGEKILASIVTGSADQNGVLLSALQMSKHYEAEPPKKVLIGGLELSQKLHDELKANLKLPIEWLKTNITGMPQQELQDYLIPISMQMKDPTEPQNEFSINLLPPTWVKRYETKRFRRRVRTILSIVTLIAGACLGIAIFSYLMLNRQVVELQSGETQNGNLPVELSEKVKSINAASDKIVKIKNGSQSAIEVINILASAAANGVEIKTYDITIDEGRVIISGNAAKREDLVNFKQNIEKNGNFSPIAIPISVYERESNLDFELDFLYLPATPKKSQPVKIK